MAIRAQHALWLETRCSALGRSTRGFCRKERDDFMAKLRKMLGRADDPQILTLMHLLETQSRRTLAGWAADCAKRRYLPIFERAFPDEYWPKELLEAVRSCLAGELAVSEVKRLVKNGRTLAREAADEPAAAAAAQAIVTACGVLQTPTNALGFVFYGAAAAAYDELGLRAAQAEYDVRAALEFDALTEHLRQVMVADEPEPIQVNWYC